MPQMGVNAGTTFTDIYNTFRPTGGGNDSQRVRFDNAKGLYTSQKGSTAKIEDMFGGNRLQQRAQKRQDGADAIQRAIGREYPRHAQAILTKLGQDHPGIDLAQGVRRSDLEAIRSTIDAVVHQPLTRATVPQTMQLGLGAYGAARLSGQDQGTYSNVSQQATKRYMDDNLGDMADPIQHKIVTAHGLPPVIEQFTRDVDRSEIRLGKKLLQSNGATDPRALLRSFTGSDQAPFHLSKMVTQHMTTALTVGVRDSLTSGDGARLMPRIGNPVGDNEKNQLITVTKHGNDYLIDYEVHAELNGFTGGGKTLDTDPNRSTVKMSMQVRISAHDLQQGNVTNYQVTQPPRYDLHVEIDPTTLPQQMRDNRL
jgi:hypothetical protein